MTKFVVLTDNTVSNLIIAETLKIAEEVTSQICVELTESVSVGIGWTYDGTNFIAPLEETPITEDAKPVK